MDLPAAHTRLRRSANSSVNQTVCPVSQHFPLRLYFTVHFNSRRRGVAVASLGVSGKLLYVEPVSTGMGDRLRAGIPSRYVTSQLGQLSPASLTGSLNGVPALTVANITGTNCYTAFTLRYFSSYSPSCSKSCSIDAKRRSCCCR